MRRLLLPDWARVKYFHLRQNTLNTIENTKADEQGKTASGSNPIKLLGAYLGT
jgi:hypothetical protein